MTGITTLWMIGMELLTLGSDSNYILMNDWDGITSIDVVTEITPLCMIGMELQAFRW